MLSILEINEMLESVFSSSLRWMALVETRVSIRMDGVGFVIHSEKEMFSLASRIFLLSIFTFIPLVILVRALPRQCFSLRSLSLSLT